MSDDYYSKYQTLQIVILHSWHK